GLLDLALDEAVGRAVEVVVRRFRGHGRRRQRRQRRKQERRKGREELHHGVLPGPAAPGGPGLQGAARGSRGAGEAGVSPRRIFITSSRRCRWAVYEAAVRSVRRMSSSTAAASG